MQFKYRQFLVLLVFVVPMLACNGLFGAQDEPQTSNSAEGQTTDSEDNGADNQPTGQENGAQQQNNSNAIAATTSLQPILPIKGDILPFQSYRILLQFTATTGEESASFQTQITRDLDNQAVSYEVTASGIPDMEEFGSNMAFVMKDGKAYIPYDGQCMAMAADGGTPMDQFFAMDAAFFDGDDVQVTYQGDETLHGLPVNIYQVNGISNADTIEASGTMHVYAASADQNVVLKAEMSGVSPTNPLTEAPQQTDVSYKFEIAEVDLAADIQIPDGCENALQMPAVGVPAQQSPQNNEGNGQAATQYPVFPGSNMVANIAGIQNFIIPQSAIDAAQISPRDFFVQELTNLGYTLAQELPAGPSINLTFQSPDSGGVQVVLVTEEGLVNGTIMGIPQMP